MNPTIQKPSYQNPFTVESPERLVSRSIVDYFVPKFTKIEVIKQRKHTFIWGSRGSGKSMMLRYLEPQCQSIIYGGIREFLGSDSAFIAVYCPCKEGRFNKTELLLLDEAGSSVLTEHLLNLHITDRLLNCLKTQFPADFFEQKTRLKFARKVMSLFDPAAIASSAAEVQTTVSLEQDPFEWLLLLFFSEQKKINSFLRQMVLSRGKNLVYIGATTGYHDFLLPFLNAAQEMFTSNLVPWYIMIDDADRLTRNQQRIINTWIANRDQSIVCLKVSANLQGYGSFRTRDGGLIEQPHDYSEVNVEELYTSSKSDYLEKVRLIANKRLELSALQTKDIEQFLPVDPGEAKLLEKMREATRKEWHEVGEPGRESDYVYRYSMARLFQHLRRTKQQKSYAGFQNMVHLSSGVIRDFLEPCYLIFDSYASHVEDPASIKSIPPHRQDDILLRYSEEFLIWRPAEIRKDLPPEKIPQLEQLLTLVHSLGQLFYDRLTDPEAREARVFSFTVTGTIEPNIKETLDMGVCYRYFQLSTYSKKEGGGRQSWYILNRRLCPIFKLDPTGFEGRISITSDLVRLACEDPDKFVRLRLKHSPSVPSIQESLFTLEGKD